MDNFYKEDIEYIELIKELDKVCPRLSLELIKVTGNAIQYGMTAMEEKGVLHD